MESEDDKTQSHGIKDDSLALEWDLLPSPALEEVIRVLMCDAVKYERDNWRLVKNARRRYFNATMRHCWAYLRGEQNDRETGLHHLAHAACYVLFILCMDTEHFPTTEETFKKALQTAREIKARRNQGKTDV